MKINLGGEFNIFKEEIMFSLTSRRNERNYSPWTFFENEVDELFDRFNRDFSPYASRKLATGPKVDIIDAGPTLEVFAEIPGLNEKDIEVSLRDNNLILKGEKKGRSKTESKSLLKCEIGFGSFYRAIPLSTEVDADRVSASYKDGILMVTLEKLPQAQSKVKKIPVSMSQSSSEAGHKH